MTTEIDLHILRLQGKAQQSAYLKLLKEAAYRTAIATATLERSTQQAREILGEHFHAEQQATIEFCNQNIFEAARVANAAADTAEGDYRKVLALAATSQAHSEMLASQAHSEMLASKGHPEMLADNRPLLLPKPVRDRKEYQRVWVREKRRAAKVQS